MVKCIICGEEAKWESTKYTSPLCSKCARKLVDKMLDEGTLSEDFYSVSDNFDRIGYEYHGKNPETSGLESIKQ